ncbi:MAG: cytidylate kinase-like family protein [Clostridiales bacterium]|nr:cytidylate kinase-like family protein [Clostridiales bacterium]
MKHFVVTIGREFGSLGREAGKELAQELGVEFYDRDLVRKAAEELGTYSYKLKELDESRPSVLSQYLFGSSDIDKLIEAQSQIIRDLAERESCIIIGRCADYILRDRDDTLNVFVYAPDQIRYAHLLETYRNKEEYKGRLNTEDDYLAFQQEIRELMNAVDHKRHDYYKYVTGINRGERYHKDLILNSGTLGVKGVVKTIKAAVEYKFGDNE